MLEINRSTVSFKHRRAGCSKTLHHTVPANRLCFAAPAVPVPASGHRGCNSRPNRFQHLAPPHRSMMSSSFQHRSSPVPTSCTTHSISSVAHPPSSTVEAPRVVGCSSACFLISTHATASRVFSPMLASPTQPQTSHANAGPTRPTTLLVPRPRTSHAPKR